jgi:extracellular matrix regulatory protein A
MRLRLLSIGFGNFVIANRIISVISPGSAPVKRIKEVAKDKGKLVDATYGRKTRAIIVMDSEHVVLSAINPETIASRLSSREAMAHDEQEIDDDSDE